MSDFAIGLWSFPVVLLLIFLRVPIGLSMFTVGFGGIWVLSGSPEDSLLRLKSEVYSTFSNYSFSIVPMFLLMGQFAAIGGMSTALFKAAEGWLGHRKGGVAMAAVGACAGFGAICGSSLATAATMGRVALPELRRYGYAGGFSTATLAAGGTLGILIPPSVVLVILAVLMEQNIAKLFLAAVIPGGFAALGYMVAIAVYVRIYPGEAGTRPRVPYGERLLDLLKIWPVLLIFLLVVVGIYRGWFSPTEGAAVGALGTALIAWATGGLNLSSFSDAFLSTAKATAMIFFIVLGAIYYNGFLTRTQLPADLANWVTTQGFSPLAILIFILVFYLILGCVMDSLSMIFLTIPIFWPVVQGLDFSFVTLVELQSYRLDQVLLDVEWIAERAVPVNLVDAAQYVVAQTTLEGGDALPNGLRRELDLSKSNQGALNRLNLEHLAIWFGVLVLIVVEVGLITPPVGMNLFVINSMDKGTPMLATYKSVLYFVASDLIRVAILVAFPIITLMLLPW